MLRFDVLRKQCNQLTYDDKEYLSRDRLKILRAITHVMDCEAYSVARQFRLREVSIIEMKSGAIYTYQICHPDICVASKTMRYQVERVHGLPLVREKCGGYVTECEMMDILRRMFSARDVCVAYKGGQIERETLDKLLVNCLNLEVLGCDKYERLLDYFDLQQKCCSQHSFVTHCSRYEVCLFAFSVLELLGLYASNAPMLRRFYCNA